MHRGWIKVWRKTLESDIWTMPPLHAKVFIWILLMADHKTGVCKTSIQKIAEGVEWEDRGCPRTPNKRTILRILDWLQDENLVSRRSNGKGNAQYTELTIINWGVYQSSESEKVTAKVTQDALKNTLKNAHMTRIEPEFKEVLQNLSADAGGSAPLEPSAGPPRVRKARVPKLPAEPTDPRVNSRSFLKRLEASGLIISWARDGKLVGEILRARLASGVEDPQEELLKLWSRFLTLDSDPVSEVFTMRGRAHDVPAFRQHLNLLIEGASGNGKVHHPQATCPDHGPGAMRREAWAGKLVLKCQTCEFAYRTEALWTDRPQSWEKDLK